MNNTSKSREGVNTYWTLQGVAGTKAFPNKLILEKSLFSD